MKDRSVRYVEFGDNDTDLLVQYLYDIVHTKKKQTTGSVYYKCPKCKDNNSLIQAAGLDTLCYECARAQIMMLIKAQAASEDDESDDEHQDMNYGDDSKLPPVLVDMDTVYSPFFTSFDSPWDFEQDEFFMFDPTRKMWDFINYPFWTLFDLGSLCNGENWEEGFNEKIIKAKVWMTKKQAHVRETHRAKFQLMRDGASSQKKQRTQYLSDGKLFRCTLTIDLFRQLTHVLFCAYLADFDSAVTNGNAATALAIIATDLVGSSKVSMEKDGTISKKRFKESRRKVWMKSATVAVDNQGNNVNKMIPHYECDSLDELKKLLKNHQKEHGNTPATYSLLTVPGGCGHETAVLIEGQHQASNTTKGNPGYTNHIDGNTHSPGNFHSRLYAKGNATVTIYKHLLSAIQDENQDIWFNSSMAPYLMARIKKHYKWARLEKYWRPEVSKARIKSNRYQQKRHLFRTLRNKAIGKSEDR